MTPDGTGGLAKGGPEGVQACDAVPQPVDESAAVELAEAPSAPPPDVVALTAMVCRPGCQDLDGAEPFVEAVTAPGVGPGDAEVRARAPRFGEPGHPPDHPVGRLARRRIDRMHEGGHPVQIVAHPPHPFVACFLDRPGLAELERPPELPVDVLSDGLVRVQLEAERAQSALLEAVVDHI